MTPLSSPIRVMLVDDHKMVRRGLAAFLQAYDDLQRAGEAENGEAAIQLCAETHPDVILMDMPEVKDIPGQENIRPPLFREMMDITISSADEEGEGLLDDLNKEVNDDELTGEGSNVSAAERQLLQQADRPITEEAKDRKKLSLDKTDGREMLNEESDPLDMGNDLDIPGTELDDENEELGEEDEENNSYSRPD